MTSSAEFHFDDFTEANYRALLGSALRQYTFVPFSGAGQDGRICLWRHDVDYSLHRARRIATIEADAGVASTYFLNVHGEFYSALGEISAGLVRDIIALGHRIGVHLDAGFYRYRPWSAAERVQILEREKALLETTFDVEVDCYSLHNPTLSPEWIVDDAVVAGMVNAYSHDLRTRFSYVSDSNGIWARQRLQEVLDSRPQRLHVLTHPEWWTPEAMSPRERISRCIDGRALWAHRYYDQFLIDCMRPNVGSTGGEEA